jgi:hypothetical protein
VMKKDEIFVNLSKKVILISLKKEWWNFFREINITFLKGWKVMKKVMKVMTKINIKKFNGLRKTEKLILKGS